MKENDIREDMNGIKSEILRDDEERKKDQLKRLQAYVEAIQKKVSSHTDEVVKELVAERHRHTAPASQPFFCFFVKSTARIARNSAII